MFQISLDKSFLLSYKGGVFIIDHSKYNNKTIGEFVKDIPEYAINYYYIVGRGCVVKLKDLLLSYEYNDIFNETIVNISEQNQDYTYDIFIK